MSGKFPDLKIEPLVAQHQRDEFCCGNDIIDGFFAKRSLKDHDNYKVRVRVATSGDEAAVKGFYSLTLKTLAPKEIGGKIGNKFGKWDIPAVYLSMIATDKTCQGGGLGFDMMFDVFEKTLSIADLAGTACLVLDAVDEETAEWYSKLSFLKLNEESLTMYITLGTIRDAREAAGY